jgi:diguanylate cyclase (GGDEF)-like protein
MPHALLELLASADRRALRRGGRGLVFEILDQRAPELAALRRELAEVADPPEESFAAGYRAAVTDWLAAVEAALAPAARERAARRLLTDHPHWWALLRAADEHFVTPTEACGLLGTSLPTASRALASLREAGVLDRVPAGKERPHRLTLLGARLLASAPAEAGAPAGAPALALYDPVPEVYAEPVFRSRLADEVREARASGGALSLLHIDIDRFTEVNDRYGFEVGDHVLARCATTVLEAARELTADAVVGRQRNGDKFLVLAPASAADARELAERIAGKARDLELPGIVAAPPTASIGVASLGTTLDDPLDLMREAREASRQAKQAGGDRVVMSPPGEPAAGEPAEPALAVGTASLRARRGGE